MNLGAHHEQPDRALGPLRFSILGPLAVESYAGPVPVRGARRRTVLVRLLIEHSRTVDLDRLADDTWGGDPSPGAPSTLRSHLAALRKFLGPERLYTKNGAAVLDLRPDDSLDVATFDAACLEGLEAATLGDPAKAETHFERALTLWHGSPLADVDDFSWALPEISRLQEQRLGALEGLFNARLDLGKDQRLITEAEYAVRQHPLREQLWAILMCAQYRSGRQAEALRSYQRLRRHLAEELGIEPSPSLQELEHAILDQSPSLDWSGVGSPMNPRRTLVSPCGDTADSDLTWLPSISEPTFIGRSDEFDLAMQTRSHAMMGSLALLLITGEPGIGKTRLAAEVARSGAAAGDLILHGRCNANPLAPFEVFRDALFQILGRPIGRALLAEDGAPVDSLAQIVPEAGNKGASTSSERLATAEAERFQSFEAIVWFIRSLAREQPVVLVLEDLHWADAPALSLLWHVLHSGISSPVLIIGTYRDTEVAEDTWLADGLVGLRRVLDVARVDLEGLPPRTSLALVESTIGSSDEDSEAIATRLREFTGGNPFFLQEVASDAVARGQPLNKVISTTNPASSGSAISERLRELVHWRLTKLSEPCKRVLSVAALTGTSFSVGILLATCDYDEAEVLAVLDEAVAAGVIGELPGSDDSYQFVHDIVRTALDAGFGTARRVRTHLRIAQELEAQHGLDPEHSPEIALHFVRGIAAGSSDRARAFCRLAGEDASTRVAHETAVLYFRQALEISATHFPEEHDAQCELLLLMADAMVRSGQLVGANETYLDAFEKGKRIGLPDVMAAAALGYGGVLPAGAEPSELGDRLLGAALVELGPDDSPSRALSLGRLAHWGQFSKARGERTRLADEGIEVAIRLGDPFILAETIEYRFWALSGPDEVTRQLGDGRRIQEIGRDCGDPELVLRGLKCELHAEFEAGDFLGANAIATEIGHLAGLIGQPEYLRLGHMWDSLVAGIQGRFDDAEESAKRAYDIFRRSGHPQSDAIAVGLSLTWLWLQGRISEMGPILEAGRTGRASVGERALAAWIAVESGNHDTARDLLSGLTPQSVAAEDRNFHWWFLMAGLSHAACGLGDADWADVLYRLIEPFSTHNCRVGQATFLGAADFYLGTLAHTAGNPILATSHLQRALTRHRSMDAAPFILLTERALERLEREGVNAAR